MSVTSIEWTDRTWNCVRGCSMAKGSELGGCLNCYAARMASRNLPEMRSPTTGKPFARITTSGPRWTGHVELIPSKLLEPLSWRKPQKVFVNSMSDLFHEALPDEDILRVFDVMRQCTAAGGFGLGRIAGAGTEGHTFQILTKRPERMRDFMGRLRWKDERLILDRAIPGQLTSMMRQIWLGVSVEDQATADERIPLLLQTPAAVRFVSYEPALGPVSFDRLTCRACAVPFASAPRPGLPQVCPRCSAEDGDDSSTLHHRWIAPMYAQASLDWVIVGGESGPGARPFDLAWARSAVEQCKAAGVGCFVKQMGSRPVSSYGQDWIGHKLDVRPTGNGLETKQHLHFCDRKGGDMSEWSEDLRVREFPEARP